MKRQQYCEYCGESLGEFEWSLRWDGHLTCGKAECDREARRDELADEEEAAARAAADRFERYR